MSHKDDAWSFMEGLDIDVLLSLKERILGSSGRLLVGPLAELL